MPSSSGTRSNHTSVSRPILAGLASGDIVIVMRPPPTPGLSIDARARVQMRAEGLIRIKCRYVDSRYADGETVVTAIRFLVDRDLCSEPSRSLVRRR